jgi:hypothetical protein
MSIGLSKSRFVAGWQCHNLLWWKVHESEAPELVSDKVARDRMEQGIAVGELARGQFPGGLLIDFPYDRYQKKIAATREALAAGAPAIFEASFSEEGVFVAVDILERTDGGFNLIEVKSTSSLKPEHVPDAAVQLYVLRAAGLPIRRVELMHLNREYRHPGIGRLFVREDITAEVLGMIDQVPAAVAEMREMLGGEFPDLPLGLQCAEISDCPFRDRCWPTARDHILTLHGKGIKNVLPLMERGTHSVLDVPPDLSMSAVARRQVRSVRAGELIAEPGLREALALLEPPLGFLDFETVSRALPPWDGLAPWGVLPAQFCYHELQPDGTYTHAEWLADGPGDPSEPIARALVAACRAARWVISYTHFERTQINTLIDRVPELAAELEDLRDRLFDLHAVVKDNVYHPDFQGSLSIKDVLPALVPELSYDDLAIQEGMDASVEIARILLKPETFTAEERERLRQDLQAYCERDTWAMVRLLETLRELAGAGS